MKETQKVLLAACEVAEKIESVIFERGMAGQELAIINAVKAAFEGSRQHLIHEGSRVANPHKD